MHEFSTNKLRSIYWAFAEKFSQLLLFKLLSHSNLHPAKQGTEKLISWLHRVFYFNLFHLRRNNTAAAIFPIISAKCLFILLCWLKIVPLITWKEMRKAKWGGNLSVESVSGTKTSAGRKWIRAPTWHQSEIKVVCFGTRKVFFCDDMK